MTQTEEGRRPEHRRPFFVRALEAAAPAMLLAVMLLLPFLGKAFTIDDTIFLRMAEHALRDPLHPSAFEMVWSEIAAPMRLSQIAPNGPVGAWLLVPALLAGGSEIVAHLMQMLLLVIAVFETAMLALRCGFDQGIARLAALLLATTPAALAMAGTAMPDIAAMTLALVGVERLLAWKADGGAGAALVAAVALGLAPLARSHALLIFLLAPLLLDDPRVAAARRQ